MTDRLRFEWERGWRIAVADFFREWAAVAVLLVALLAVVAATLHRVALTNRKHPGIIGSGGNTMVNPNDDNEIRLIDLRKMFPREGEAQEVARFLYWRATNEAPSRADALWPYVYSECQRHGFEIERREVVTDTMATAVEVFRLVGPGVGEGSRWFYTPAEAYIWLSGYTAGRGTIDNAEQ